MALRIPLCLAVILQPLVVFKNEDARSLRKLLAQLVISWPTVVRSAFLPYVWWSRARIIYIIRFAVSISELQYFFNHGQAYCMFLFNHIYVISCEADAHSTCDTLQSIKASYRTILVRKPCHLGKHREQRSGELPEAPRSARKDKEGPTLVRSAFPPYAWWSLSL